MALSELPTGHLAKRLTALVYDSLVLTAVALAYGALFLAVKHAIFDVELAQNERATIGTPGFVGLVLVLQGFYWFFWCRGGQTLGMKAWRLQLIQENGAAPTILQAMVRGMIAPFSFFLFGLGFWWSLWEPQGRSWHDLASGTRVVQLPK